MSQLIGIGLTLEQLDALISKAVQTAIPLSIENYLKEHPKRKKLLTGNDVQEEYGIMGRTLEKMARRWQRSLLHDDWAKSLL